MIGASTDPNNAKIVDFSIMTLPHHSYSDRWRHTHRIIHTTCHRAPSTLDDDNYAKRQESVVHPLFGFDH